MIVRVGACEKTATLPCCCLDQGALPTERRRDAMKDLAAWMACGSDFPGAPAPALRPTHCMLCMCGTDTCKGAAFINTVPVTARAQNAVPMEFIFVFDLGSQRPLSKKFAAAQARAPILVAPTAGKWATSTSLSGSPPIGWAWSWTSPSPIRTTQQEQLLASRPCRQKIRVSPSIV
eukprot:762675-Hanusia_phi.AAC.2